MSFGWANIFLTAPAPENLKTVFQFLISGLQALRYIEHVDYSVIFAYMVVVSCAGSFIETIFYHRLRRHMIPRVTQGRS